MTIWGRPDMSKFHRATSITWRFGGDQIVGSLGQFVPPFRRTFDRELGDCTTMMGRRGVCEVPRSQPSFVLLSMQDKTEEELFLQCWSLVQDLTHLLDRPHLSFSGAPSSTRLLSSLISGPDLGAWSDFDCWPPSLGRGRVTPPPLLHLHYQFIEFQFLINFEQNIWKSRPIKMYKIPSNLFHR